MTAEPHNSVKVFYSYAHEDEELRDELVKHLANLRRQGVITEWYDREISAGKEWDEEIGLHLDSARVILLLISPDFMNSDYSNDVEVKRAMERHEAGDARVIPIILRPVDWEGAPFSKLQSLPSDVMPVTLWENQDEAFLDVTRGIRKAIQELSEPSVIVRVIPDIPRPPKVAFVSRRDREGADIAERLREALAPEKNQLVALWGAGGVGKTAIASEAVRVLIEVFANRIAWVSADGLESFGLTTLLDSIASQLGVPDLRKLSLELKKEQVRDLVKTAPTLIVLDNFETIETAERARCVDWLGNPAPCSALITTRDMIEGAHNIPIEVMRTEEAHILLNELIAQTHDSRAFAKLDRGRLIETGEANPLVLQWIVGQIDLAQDPDEVLDDLRHGEGTAAERVFDRSFQLEQLNNGGRAVLLALSLFAPSATRKAVAEVSGLGKDSDKKKFKEAVKSLSALWLLHTTDESRRLAVEGLTRELTKARLDGDPRGKTFRPRFVLRFLRHATAHSRPMREDYDALELEKDNLLSATDVAYNLGDARSVLQLAYVLATPVISILGVRGYWDEALQIGTLALRIARSSQSEEEVAAWSHNVAMMHHDRGEFDEARTLYDESLEIKRKGKQSVVANTLHQLAMLAHDQGDLSEARRLYDESLETNKKHGGEAGTLHQLAKLAQDQGELDEARRLYGQSLRIDKKLGNQTGVAIILRSQGNLAQDQGEFGEARRLYDESLEIATRLGDQSGTAISLHGLGTVHLAEKDYDSAEKFLQESLDILRKLGDKQSVAECLESIAKLRVQQGRLPAAQALNVEALEIANRLGIPFRIGSVKHSLALCAEEQGDKTRAAQLLLEALTIFEMLRSPRAKDARRDLERINCKES